MIKNQNNIEKILFENVELPLSKLGLDYHNNSHYFLLPLFDLRGVYTHKSHYINSYIGDCGRDVYMDRCLYTLFGFKDLDSKEFDSVNRYFHKIPEFKFSYYAGINNGKNLIMYVSKCSEQNSKDYDSIVSGKYSEVSGKYRDKYTSYPFLAENRPGTIHRSNRGTVDFLDGITLKLPAFRKVMEDFLGCSIKGELWNIFEDSREMFRYDNKKNHREAEREESFKNS